MAWCATLLCILCLLYTSSFAVGEWMNGDPFELALALVRYGFRVPEIYGTLSGENFIQMCIRDRFGIVHVLGQDFSIGSCLLVIIAGTMVGVMFQMCIRDRDQVAAVGMKKKNCEVSDIADKMSKKKDEKQAEVIYGGKERDPKYRDLVKQEVNLALVSSDLLLSLIHIQMCIRDRV